MFSGMFLIYLISSAIGTITQNFFWSLRSLGNCSCKSFAVPIFLNVLKYMILHFQEIWRMALLNVRFFFTFMLHKLNISNNSFWNNQICKFLKLANTLYMPFVDKKCIIKYLYCEFYVLFSERFFMEWNWSIAKLSLQSPSIAQDTIFKFWKFYVLNELVLRLS